MTLLQMKPYSNIGEEKVDARHAMDRIQAMAEQEQHYCSCDYFRVSTTCDTESRPPPKMTDLSDLRADAHCRMKMCKWCYQVVDYFKFSRETVQISMSFFDRFLVTPQGRPYLEDRSVFQLACVTCLYLAIKVHEPIELDISFLCELSRGSYSVSQIIRMERVILEALQWRLNPPTATSFVQHIFAVLSSSLSVDERKSLMDVALYQAELAVFDHDLVVTNSASAIATAAVFNAMESIKISECTRSLQMKFATSMCFMTGITPNVDGVQDCRTQLLRCMHEDPRKSSCVPCSESPLVRRISVGKILEMEGQLAIAMN